MTIKRIQDAWSRARVTRRDITVNMLIIEGGTWAAELRELADMVDKYRGVVTDSRRSFPVIDQRAVDSGSGSLPPLPDEAARTLITAAMHRCTNPGLHYHARKIPTGLHCASCGAFVTPWVWVRCQDNRALCEPCYGEHLREAQSRYDESTAPDTREHREEIKGGHRW